MTVPIGTSQDARKGANEIMNKAIYTLKIQRKGERVEGCERVKEKIYPASLLHCLCKCAGRKAKDVAHLIKGGSHYNFGLGSLY